MLPLAVQGAKKERMRRKPMRGAFWPRRVEDIDPPNEGMEPVPMEKNSEVARLFLWHGEELMMDPGGKANLEEI